MNYKSFNLGDWIGHINGVIEDESELDGDEMRDLVDFLTTLNQESRWIPVSERLPEKEGLYLVSVKNDHERRYSKTCCFHGKGNGWFARQDVEAWMPLPEPYKEESEEKEK